MALLDILTGGRSTGSGRVPPIAMALLGLLTYNKLKKPAGEATTTGPGDDWRIAPSRISSSPPPPAVRRRRASSARC